MTKITQIISMVCNCSCPYCMCGKKLSRTIPDEEVSLKSLIDFYDKIDSNEELNIKITGGEPTHHLIIDKTVGLIEYLSENKNLKSVQLNTNGYFEIPDSLLNNKLVHFQFSLDGNKEYQNSITGVDIYDKLISNIDKVINNGSDAHIMCVVTDDNLKYLSDVKDIARKHHIDIRMQYVAPVGKGTKYAASDDYVKDKIDKLNEKYACRHFIDVCEQKTGTDDVKFTIDNTGNIVNCPYMQRLKTEMTIFNTSPDEKDKIKIILKETLKGRTCRSIEGE